jgi:hypothetical protein
MALPKAKRQTAEPAAAFAKNAVEQNEFQRSWRHHTGLFRPSTVPWTQAGKIASQSRIEWWSRPLPSGAVIGFRGLWMWF